jgi:exodeoxyribonuclease III
MIREFGPAETRSPQPLSTANRGLVLSRSSAASSGQRMKIATFNVNNVNKRLDNLLDWLRTSRPDVTCLQELKATDSQFPVAAIEKAGYGAVWRGQKSWNGVAILARDCEPVVTRSALPGDPEDTQSRYIEAAVNGVLVATLYAPNGNPQPGPKFKYKLAWMKRLLAHAAELYALDAPVALAGGFQRRTDRRRHLSNPVIREERACSARAPGPVSANSRSGLDRCDPDDAS